jgi:hypothetical protein
MKLIPLSQQGEKKGKYFTEVDDDDFAYLNQWKWSITSWGYVVRTIGLRGLRKQVRMHREVMKVTNKNYLVDHIDGNTLNNQKSNLRVCNHKENSRNQRMHKRSSSGFKGVTFKKASSCWVAQVATKHVGLFAKKHHAAMAYDMAAKDLFGEYAVLNFPSAINQ